MNPFEEEEEETRPVYAKPPEKTAVASSPPSKAAGNPFASGAGSRSSSSLTFGYGSNVETTKRKAPAATAGNPFAEDLRPQPYSSSAPKNPFASGTETDLVRSLDSDLGNLQISANVVEKEKSVKMTPTEYREGGIKRIVIGDSLSLLVTYRSNIGESQISRRDLSTFNRVDGSIIIRDIVDEIFADPSSTHALLIVKPTRASQTEAVFYLSPQDAVLKLKGPLPALSGLSAVGWFEENNDFAAVLGTTSGVVQLAHFSHNGVSDLIPLFVSPQQSPGRIISVLPRPGKNILVFESSGAFHVIDWSGTRVCGDSLFQKHNATKTETVIKAIAGSEDDYWAISSQGLHHISLSSNSTTVTVKLILEVEGCFAITQTRLHMLVLVRFANQQSNVITTKLLVISKVTRKHDPRLDKTKLSVQGASPLGIARDETQGTVLIFSEQGVSVVEIQDETRGAWSLYLDRAINEGNEGDFQRAFDLCEYKQNKDLVRSAHGDWNLSQKRFVQAAELYASINNATKPFEEVALLLSSPASGQSLESSLETLQRKKALRIFLLGRLERLKDAKKTLRAMLCVWTCEAFLNEMDELKSEIDKRKAAGDDFSEQEMSEVESEFCAFLGRHCSTLEPAREVIFHLIQSHGRTDMLLVYADVVKDYDRVVRHHMQRGAPREAVRAIRECARENQAMAAQLFYSHSPQLITLCPDVLIDAWLQGDEYLDPARLVPALTRFEDNPNVRPHALVYLEHCVVDLGVRDEIVHNCLLEAYSTDENMLSHFIRRETSQPGGFCFDAGLALRICEKVSPRSTIVLLDAMNMPEAACVAALEAGLTDVAQKIASEQFTNRGSREMSKRLWLLCCKHALTSAEDQSAARRALDVLRASGGIVGIEDLLQLLPESIKLDEVRDEVCVALEKYNSSIDHLKAEMAEHIESDQALLRDARDEKRRFDVIRAAKRCDICRKHLFVQAPNGQSAPVNELDEFYVFPCTHTFHTGCLCTRLSPQDSQRIARLIRSTDEADQAVVEEIIGASCPLCGDLMIESIAQPLIFARDEAEARKWDVTPQTMG